MLVFHQRSRRRCASSAPNIVAPCLPRLLVKAISQVRYDRKKARSHEQGRIFIELIGKRSLRASALLGSDRLRCCATNSISPGPYCGCNQEFASLYGAGCDQPVRSCFRCSPDQNRSIPRSNGWRMEITDAIAKPYRFRCRSCGFLYGGNVDGSRMRCWPKSAPDPRMKVRSALSGQSWSLLWLTRLLRPSVARTNGRTA